MLRAVAYRAFRVAAETAEALHNPTLSSLAQGSLAHLYEREGRARRGVAPDRPGGLRGAAGIGTRALVPLGLAAGAPGAQARADGSGADQLSPRRRGTAVGPPGYSGRVPRRPLLLSNHLRPGLSRIQRPAAAPGVIRSRPGSTAHQGGAGYHRAAQGDRAAGLFPRFLRHQFRRQAALDRNHRAGNGRDLPDCAARPARAPGQLRRRAAAIHLADTGSDPARRGPALPRIAREAHDKRISGAGPAALRPDHSPDRAGSCRPPHRYAGGRSRLHVAHCPVRGIARRQRVSLDRYATAIAPSLQSHRAKTTQRRARYGAGARDFEERPGLCPAAQCRTRGRGRARHRGRTRAAQRFLQPGAVRGRTEAACPTISSTSPRTGSSAAIRARLLCSPSTAN